MRTTATKPDIDAALRKYAASLGEGLRIEAIILFGSYAKGEPGEWSDFDVAVISPNFEGTGLAERQETLAKLSLGTDPRISPIGYPSSEYHNPGPHSFLREIVRTGRIVYQNPNG